jgi:hypothetical protein
VAEFEHADASKRQARGGIAVHARLSSARRRRT